MKKKRASNNPDGRPALDPSGQPRVALSLRVNWITRDRLDEIAELREAATGKAVSLGQLIDECVEAIHRTVTTRETT